MKDRLTLGFWAGVIGDLPTTAFSFLAGALGWTDTRTADLIALIVYARPGSFTFGEIAFALLGHLIVAGALGVGFAYWIAAVTSRNLWLKGIIYAQTIWWSTYSLTTFFETPGTVPTPLNTAVTDGIATTIFGLSLAFALQALGPAESQAAGFSAAPARKPLDPYRDEDNSDLP